MARRKIRKQGQGEIGKVQMAPMVDVVFQLLIFFLVSSEVRPNEADFMTNLPAGSGPADRQVPAKEPYRVYLENDASGNVKVTINGAFLGMSPDGFAVLLERLKNLPKKENMLLVIDGDPSVKVQYIAAVLDAAVEAKVPSITFGKPKS